jgi:hypothetical protein
MIEFNDADGRLIVAFRVNRNNYCVYVAGQWDSEFPSGREALAYKRSVAMQGQSDSSEPRTKTEHNNAE